MNYQIKSFNGQGCSGVNINLSFAGFQVVRVIFYCLPSQEIKTHTVLHSWQKKNKKGFVSDFFETFKRYSLIFKIEKRFL